MAAQDFSTYDILPCPGLIKLSLLESKRLLTESGMRGPSPSENLEWRLAQCREREGKKCILGHLCNTLLFISLK